MNSGLAVLQVYKQVLPRVMHEDVIGPAALIILSSCIIYFKTIILKQIYFKTIILYYTHKSYFI